MDRFTPENRNDQIEAVWTASRRRLLDVGYRMLGSMSDAEDVAAEAYARLLAADLDTIEDPTGWLISVTGRLCIDRLRSAERTRRSYVGPWLPEPVSAESTASVDPADRVTLDESVRMALLVVLEQLSPAERTSFVLHDLFGMTFEEVAAIVGRSPAACRQLASRARRRVRSDANGSRVAIGRDELEQVAERFADACSTGALEPLLDILDPEVIGDFDSGGTVPGAPLHALNGARPVARVLMAAFSRDHLSFSVHDLNGDPGVVVRQGSHVAAAIAIEARNGRVRLIHGVGNPDKLRHLGL